MPFLKPCYEHPHTKWVLHADAVRARVCGDVVTYVVNRNINNTNVCTFACAFCAFSKVRVEKLLPAWTCCLQSLLIPVLCFYHNIQYTQY